MMLNHPFAAYRSRHQQLGPWHLRLIAAVFLGLLAAVGYWLVFPRVIVELIHRHVIGG